MKQVGIYFMSCLIFVFALWDQTVKALMCLIENRRDKNR